MRGSLLIRWTFRTGDARYAVGLRQSFRASLQSRDIDEGDLFVAEVVMGELIGNVVRHAPGSIEASYEDDGTTLVLHVRDCGNGFSTDHGDPGVYAESGRGLHIIRSLGGVLTVQPGAGGSHTSVRIELGAPLAMEDALLAS